MPAAGRDIIRQTADGAFAAITVLEEDVEVGHLTGELKVRVGDRAARVGGGDQVGLYGQGKGRSPYEG